MENVKIYFSTNLNASYDDDFNYSPFSEYICALTNEKVNGNHVTKHLMFTVRRLEITEFITILIEPLTIYYIFGRLVEE